MNDMNGLFGLRDLWALLWLGVGFATLFGLLRGCDRLMPEPTRRAPGDPTAGGPR